VLPDKLLEGSIALAHGLVDLLELSNTTGSLVVVVVDGDPPALGAECLTGILDALDLYIGIEVGNTGRGEGETTTRRVTATVLGAGSVIAKESLGLLTRVLGSQHILVKDALKHKDSWMSRASLCRSTADSCMAGGRESKCMAMKRRRDCESR
jgi:hypothetical protein